MRVAVLTPSFAGSTSCFAAVDDIHCTPQHYFNDGQQDNLLTFSHTPVLKATAAQQVATLHADAVINLCDGAWDEDRAGIEVVHALARHNMAFTGADARCFDQSKPQQKAAALCMGVDTPRAVVIEGMMDDKAVQQALAHAAATLVFPLIVKHPRGYGSIGLTPASKVRNGTELHTQVAMALHAWGAALVEEFVVGREATVLVVEDVEHSGVRALKPVECVFVPDGVADDVQQEKRNGQQQDGQQQQEGLSWFKDFATKFGVEDQHGGGGGIHKVTMTWKPMYSPQDTVLVNQLCSAACKVFRALGCTGYARADFRIQAHTNTPWFLELNPNCGVFYPPGRDEASADVILRHDGDQMSSSEEDKSRNRQCVSTSTAMKAAATTGMVHSSKHTCSTEIHTNTQSIGGHRGFVHTIIASALRHRAARRLLVRPWCVPGSGQPVLQCLLDMAPGQVVLVLQKQPQWTHDEHHQHRPHVLLVPLPWGPVPWWPIAHDASNPTCMLQGTTLVAGRAICAKQDMLSVDYGCPLLV